MLPIKHSAIFRSRWWALLWAAGILWSAVEFVDAQPNGTAPADGANGAAPADGTPGAIADALG